MGDPPETTKEKSNRQLIELLTELRVMLPGSQIVLGLLLTIPFTNRFGSLTRIERGSYLVALGAAVVGTMLLMSPAIHHRVLWRHGVKPHVVVLGHRSFLAGTAMLGLGLGAVLFLIVELVAGLLPAVVCSSTLLGGLVLLWYVAPVVGGRGEETHGRRSTATTDPTRADGKDVAAWL